MWNIAAAKQDLSRVLKAAELEPQVIANRGRPVAAVIAYASLEPLLKANSEARTLASLLDPLREALLTVDVRLVAPPRTTRPNPMIDVLHDAQHDVP